LEPLFHVEESIVRSEHQWKLSLHFHCLLWLKDRPKDVEQRIREAAKSQNILIIEDIRSYFDEIIDCVNPSKEIFSVNEQRYKHDKSKNPKHPSS